jgi:tRNA dimethylallyltransferase
MGLLRWRACPALRAVGYREVWRYLAGELDYPTMLERSITATAQYAKRQYTWFRAEDSAVWLDPAVSSTREILIAALSEAANRAPD